MALSMAALGRFPGGKGYALFIIMNDCRYFSGGKSLQKSRADKLGKHYESYQESLLNVTAGILKLK